MTVRELFHVAIREVFHVAIREVFHVTIREVFHVAIREVFHVAILFLLSADFLNELSNDGARAQFEKYLQTDLLQAMVQCAQVSGILVLKRLPQNVGL